MSAIVVDPAVAIQKVTYAALTAAGALPTIDGVQTPVYDRVPKGAQPPYATIGDDHVMEDAADDYAGEYVFSNVHLWSRAGGRVEVKQMAGAARAALSVELDATAYGVRIVGPGFWVDTKILDDPDGVTAHAIVTMKYGTEPLG